MTARAERRPPILAVLIATLAGCATLGGLDAERERSEARADHAVCAKQALPFPSEGYTHCRRRIAEERQRRQWMEQSLAQQQSGSRTPDYLPIAPPGVYTPIDPARYRCVAEQIADEELIQCRER